MCLLSVSGKMGTFDQDLLPLIGNFLVRSLRLEFVMYLGILLYWVVLVFEHFILYESFVTNCQMWRLLSSKSLKQLANREHKLV